VSRWQETVVLDVETGSARATGSPVQPGAEVLSAVVSDPVLRARPTPRGWGPATRA